MADNTSGGHVVAEINEKYRMRTNRVFERQWQLNMAFYVGNQYVNWSRVTNQLMPVPKLRSHQVRLVVNKILPAVQMAVGKMMKNKPRAEVIPPDGDERKVNIAKVATKVLEYRDRLTNFEDKLQQMATWAVITGNGFMKHTWNPALGEPMEIDGEVMNEGDEETTVCSPFEITVDPLAIDVESARWMMHHKLQSHEYVKEMWGIDIQATETAAQDSFGMMDMRLVGDAILGGVYMPPKGILVKEYWERPGEKYPDGRLIIVAGDKLVYDGKNYMGELPFVHFKWNVVPNSFWAKGMVEDIIPLQKNYNRRRSQIAENANLLSNPQWLAPMGSFLPGKEPTNAPAGIVEFNPIVQGVAPHIEPVPPLPPQIYEDMNQTDQEMSSVSGMREIGPGMLPPGIRAAAALALVNEMDQTQMTPVTSNFEYVVRTSARMRLKLIKMFYSTPREIHIAGPNRSFAVEQFKGSDLEGEFDISIQSVSGLPQDKTARFQLLQQLAQMGIIDQLTFIRLMELSDVDEIFEDMQGDMNAAEWAIEQIKKGKVVPVHDYENHQIALYVINRWRRSLEFKKLSQHIQDLADVYARAHEEFMQEQQQNQPSTPPQSEQQAIQMQQSAQQRANQADQLLGVQPMQFSNPNPLGMQSYNPASALQSGMTSVGNQAALMQG